MGQKKTVVTDIDTGISTMLDGLKGLRGHNYALLTRTDKGEITATVKVSKPCYGELRPYKTDVIPEQKATRGADYKPGDLPDRFPEGEVLAVAVTSNQVISDKLANSELWQTAWSTKGPWGSALASHQLVVDKDTPTTPIHLWTETDFAPTVLVSLLMSTRYLNEQKVDIAEQLRKDRPKWKPNLLFAATYCSSLYNGHWSFGEQDGYSLALSGASLSRFVKGHPFDLDGGFTFRQRAAYNRPHIQFLFGKDWGVIPSTTNKDLFLDMMDDLAKRPEPETPTLDKTDLLAAATTHY